MYHNDSMRYPPGYYEQQYNFDFFNYAGIHRPVILYTTVTTNNKNQDLFSMYIRILHCA